MTSAPEGPAGPVPAPVLPDHPEAAKALVLGLISMVGTFTCLLPMLLGPYAWVVGRRVVRAIDAEPQRWGGRPQASAGQVMGVVTTVMLGLGLLVLVGFLLFFVFMFFFLDTRLDQPLLGTPA